MLLVFHRRLVFGGWFSLAALFNDRGLQFLGHSGRLLGFREDGIIGSDSIISGLKGALDWRDCWVYKVDWHLAGLQENASHRLEVI